MGSFFLCVGIRDLSLLTLGFYLPIMSGIFEKGSSRSINLSLNIMVSLVELLLDDGLDFILVA